MKLLLLAAIFSVAAFAQNPKPCTNVTNTAAAGQVLTASRAGSTPPCTWKTDSLGSNVFINGLALTGATFPSVRAYNLGTGDIDLYQAPTAKRAIVTIVGGFNPGGNSVTWFTELKSGGLYYRLSANGTTTTGTGATGQTPNIVLEPGESISVNTTASGINLTVGIVQFDSTSPLRTVKVAAPASGNSTFYTVPAGKTAILLPAILANLGATGIRFSAGSTGSGAVNICFVAAGGSTACAANSVNEIVGGASVGTNAVANLVGQVTLTMSAGDFLVINVATGGDAAQMVFATVLEF